jgi:hypothetical protein
MVPNPTTIYSSGTPSPRHFFLELTTSRQAHSYVKLGCIAHGREEHDSKQSILARTDFER